MEIDKKKFFDLIVNFGLLIIVIFIGIYRGYFNTIGGFVITVTYCCVVLYRFLASIYLIIKSGRNT